MSVEVAGHHFEVFLLEAGSEVVMRVGVMGLGVGVGARGVGFKARFGLGEQGGGFEGVADLARVPAGFFGDGVVTRGGEFEDALLVAEHSGRGGGGWGEEWVEVHFPDAAGLFLRQGRVVEFDVDAGFERVVELLDSVCREEYYA